MHGQSSRWIFFKFGHRIQLHPGHNLIDEIFQHVLSARSAEPILVPPQLPGPPYRHTKAATPHHNAKVLGGSFFKFGHRIQLHPGHNIIDEIFQHVLSARSAEPILVFLFISPFPVTLPYLLQCFAFISLPSCGFNPYSRF